MNLLIKNFVTFLTQCSYKIYNQLNKIIMTNKTKEVRPLSTIAREIYNDWGAKVNYAAKPYLEAMTTLTDIKDNYYMDSGKSIVLYFLSNASSWRGETAKRVKKELNGMLKG